MALYPCPDPDMARIHGHIQIALWLVYNSTSGYLFNSIQLITNKVIPKALQSMKVFKIYTHMLEIVYP